MIWRENCYIWLLRWKRQVTDKRSQHSNDTKRTMTQLPDENIHVPQVTKLSLLDNVLLHLYLDTPERVHLYLLQTDVTPHEDG